MSNLQSELSAALDDLKRAVQASEHANLAWKKARIDRLMSVNDIRELGSNEETREVRIRSENWDLYTAYVHGESELEIARMVVKGLLALLGFSE